MTEEEINEKAEKHCNEVLCNAHEKCNEVIKCRDWRSRRAGFYCGYEQATKELQEQLTEAKKIISEWEDSFCCGADYLYLGNKGKELRIKSQKFLNNNL